MSEQGNSLAPYLTRLQALHPRLCPRQVLGVRMGLRAGEVLGLEVPRPDKRLLVLVEMDGCFADGISVATNCWLGRRTLRLVDHGKAAATVVDTLDGRAVRVRPHALARSRAWAYAPAAADNWHAQLAGYQDMPAGELLCWEEVALNDSLARLLGQEGQRVTCAGCGEEVMNGREVLLSGLALCRQCAGERYFRPLGGARVGGTVSIDES